MNELPRVTYSNTGEDFSGVHAHLDAIIPDVEARLLGKLRLAHIGGRDRGEGPSVEARSPIDRDILLGEFPIAGAALVDEAVAAARAAYPSWRRLGWQRRVAILRAGADLIDRNKWDISVACLIEVGKSRLEAVGEVEEAIDLIRHYCDEMERAGGFHEDRPGASSAERCAVELRPYGVFGVIAPFNFPVALSLGMMSAALIAGNTVLFKPSDAAGLTGRLVVEALISGGLPDGVLNLVYGRRDTGEAMVGHPGIDGFAFTGSNAVGMTIMRAAASSPAMRPVLAEMGGKNPAFITPSANLAVAASGVARSAFGLSGQKCSALSKVYVERGTTGAFLDALVEVTDKLAVGDPRRAEIFMGPVINEKSMERFTIACTEAASAGSILIGGTRLGGGQFDRGPYAAPTVVTGLPRDHRINRDELFLPFLSVLEYDHLDEALADANGSAFGLTAGIYTRDKAELDHFIDTIEAGVLYANRASGATTGAWPGFQTFCGWKGSGTSGKGGLGSWYVPQFMREQSHTLFGTL
ncbi:aldehyde dehydrogenase family protein [Sphingomonas sp. RB56-2]|uniref:L-glutamate gamma-semialdehyde dehydrogenase n=1 Tax=Sphingomonas brevis TaxID=2908206 RepID=A0ABT0S9C8_9SPHN|nr:aldehyde dehydrogenase family protein [Sphingomonas brevis]MCL6740994.1 aldehyde dehydrogenase family protein [Sphingomonas brevis]